MVQTSSALLVAFVALSAAPSAFAAPVNTDSLAARSIWGTLLTDAERIAKPLLKDAASEAAKSAGQQAGALAVSKVGQAIAGPTPAAQKAVAKKVKRDSVDSRSIWGTLLTDAERIAKPLLKDAASEAAKSAGQQAGALAVSKVGQAIAGPTPAAQKAAAKKVKRDSVDSRSIWGTLLSDAERVAKPLLKDAASEAAKSAGQQAGALAVSKVGQAIAGPTPAAQKAVVNKKAKRDLFGEAELLERFFDEYLASRSYGDFDELD